MLAYSFLQALQTSTLLEQNSYEPVKWGLNTILTVYTCHFRGTLWLGRRDLVPQKSPTGEGGGNLQGGPGHAGVQGGAASSGGHGGAGPSGGHGGSGSVALTFGPATLIGPNIFLGGALGFWVGMDPGAGLWVGAGIGTGVGSGADSGTGAITGRWSGAGVIVWVAQTHKCKCQHRHYDVLWERREYKNWSGLRGEIHLGTQDSGRWRESPLDSGRWWESPWDEGGSHLWTRDEGGSRLGTPGRRRESPLDSGRKRESPRDSGRKRESPRDDGGSRLWTRDEGGSRLWTGKKEGVASGLGSWAEADTGADSGAGAISGLQDIPSYSTKRPKGTNVETIMAEGSGVAAAILG
ncbi:hypothetical protein DPX16_10902 [Anabarilius grahami]|uniref:Uncharacterized protein n=1 Tax=Anabarilius grahami TaxID=495550 RepID=A0A3N0Z7P4_ANAGA|nr:hypothetical protein DPX16_10902 [Anabarilius grahami]